MDTIKFAEPRALHADGGRYDAYWLRQARATRGVARFLAASTARFGRWLVNMIRAREVLAAIPAEGSPCVQGVEVDCARHLLLGHEGTRDRAG